ncbi:hypothetical protein MKW92_045687 [Papaver armeniacum]|nr:hypothetical protein MKW92_045687 [Papaver armeniacum]
MAVSSSCTTSLTSLLIFLFVVTASTAATTGDGKQHFDVSTLCPLVKDKEYCQNILISNEAKYDAMDAKNRIVDLFPKAAGAQRVHLKFCQQLYDSFLQNDLKSLSQLLVKKDYTGLQREAGVFAKYASDCEKSFEPTPSPLAVPNSNFFNDMDMISAFSYLLIHPSG